MSDTPRTDAEVPKIIRRHSLDMEGALIDLADFARELERDAARFEWALPILTAAGDEGDRRALTLAKQFLLGLDGREALDAAMRASPPA